MADAANAHARQVEAPHGGQFVDAEQDRAALLLRAAEVGEALASIADGIGQDVAAVHFSHGAEILRTHADLIQSLGQ